MFFRGAIPPACDVDVGSSTRWRLVYEVYQYFLPEGDLSERSLISSLERVANVQNVQDNSRKVSEISLSVLPYHFLLSLVAVKYFLVSLQRLFHNLVYYLYVYLP